MEFRIYFEKTVEGLVGKGELPMCEWEDWEFLQPKQPERGDFCTFAVLRTVMKANKNTGNDYQSTDWCIKILNSLPMIPTVESVYAENGIINLRIEKGEKEKSTEKSIMNFEPIGFISTCFSEKFGTPRQSFYTKYSRGEITLLSHINPDSLDGLEEFSHIWLIFVFHKSAHSKFKTKIKPPRLNGAKKGIFATRAPHRYNPIGLSLAKIENISERTIKVSGIDLIDSTPILDIKPYHPADSISNYLTPNYILNPIFVYSVEFHEYACERIEFIKINFPLKFYSAEEDWQEIISEVLAQDPSTVHTKLKHKDLGLYAFKIDFLYVVYIRNSEKMVNLVVDVTHRSENVIHSLRSEVWLQEAQEKLLKLGVLTIN